jgi:hypothetical protein
MNPSPVRRVSIVLPIRSARASIAAIQIVLYLLDHLRVELDLLRGPAAEEAGLALLVRRPRTVLFVRAVSDAPDGRPVSNPDFEETLRARIERSYARQGLSNVQYDLHLL